MSRSSWQATHNIFIDAERVARTDGRPVEAGNLVRQRAMTTCSICGLVVVNPDWPTGEWHHATPSELAVIAARQD